MSEAPFLLTERDLEDTVFASIVAARARGANDVAAIVTEASQLNVGVRDGEIDALQHLRSKELEVTVYIDGRRGVGVTNDFSRLAIEGAADAACAIARHVDRNPDMGLVDDRDSLGGPNDGWDLDLFHPWDITPDQAIEFARSIEAEALSDPSPSAGIAIRSNGAGLTASQRQFKQATTKGFLGGYPSSLHMIRASVIAQDASGMQNDEQRQLARADRDLPRHECLGRLARDRALARLSSRKIETAQVPVLFEASVVSRLTDPLIAAITGGAQVQGQSFLQDMLGRTVLADHVSLEERPHILAGLQSRPFDEEGVRTRDLDIISDGVLRAYLLTRHTARRLGMPLTGHAGGHHNLRLVSRDTSADDGMPAMLRRLGAGLLVTDIAGGGVDRSTGNLSVGVAGQWVENGVVQYPVEEVTVAGPLPELLRDLVAIGADVHTNRSITAGSVLLGEMRVAGA